MAINTNVKVIAFYLPQYHQIPENDQWWGEGFTDWVNVKRAQSYFPGHYQPRAPLNKFYYDLSDKEVLKWQIKLARENGLFGFCHYHYWFDGKQLLETPTNIMLREKDLDFPFCLAWANCTWSRRWDGDENEKSVLMKQTHTPDRKRWTDHFNYLIKAWKDPRAIKVDGKPVFLIYKPHIIDRVDELLGFWRSMAIEHGLKGVHFVAMQQFEFINKNFLKCFDAVVPFQPAVSMFIPGSEDGFLKRTSFERYVRSLPRWLTKPLKQLKNMLPDSLTFHDYDVLWGKILEHRPDTPHVTYAGAFIDWDNTARYKGRARIVQGANPERFEFWFRQLVENTANKPKNERLIFLNAWNEWAEGCYLEPDERYQYQYLHAVKRCL